MGEEEHVAMGDEPATSTCELLKARLSCTRQERRAVKLQRDMAVMEDDEERALHEKLQQRACECQKKALTAALEQSSDEADDTMPAMGGQ